MLPSADTYREISSCSNFRDFQQARRANIRYDVGEDSHRRRIYLPLEDLALFDYNEAELLPGVIDARW